MKTSIRHPKETLIEFELFILANRKRPKTNCEIRKTYSLLVRGVAFCNDDVVLVNNFVRSTPAVIIPGTTLGPFAVCE
ncbi:hypothetical protein DERP_011901 [Dermatophagoides pteronyssinus]|uniref:Uncharacterized protein n=1 Tax=Dermatophagoides pteronyssinus TaxID=6956 RepID=A0ABQ8J2W2_DERPT|nr:hypothetical protein DERP_011901 [Dermatophagoides pteronyssinus]